MSNESAGLDGKLWYVGRGWGGGGGRAMMKVS